MCIFTITWFHNSTVAHPFLIGFKSMTIASIQDFPMETFEHAFEIDVEHAEFHSYFSSVSFSYCLISDMPCQPPGIFFHPHLSPLSFLL